VKHQARKRFGQNFLTDEAAIAAIVAAINPAPGECLVEIGPGLGALTRPLLTAAGQLHAIEIDRDLAQALAQEFGARLKLHTGDVLKYDFSALGERLRVIGNLPYNISTPLLFRMIEQRQHIRDMHFMLQKEVVDRMAAAPDTEHYGRLTVMLAPWLRVEPLFDIGPGAFRPPPRVTSTFVRLAAHEEPLRIEHPRCYANVVAAAFSQRRKTLRNALKAILSQEDIRAAGIDPGARAETVPAAGFAALAAELARKTSL
jgi:16S rRNA (adenine1518-N6/adenine1519-N6)-dimethyltransferase